MKTWSKDEKRTWTELKRQYSDDLSREITKEIEQNLQSHFPKTYSGLGVGSNAASAHGVKSIDVAFNIEGLFLGLGVSVKTVGLPEEDRRLRPQLQPDGEVRFVDVVHHLKPLEKPTRNKLQTFDRIKDDLVRLFRQRNPKLRVKGMPEVDDTGAVTAASPALDEALAGD